MPDIFLNANFPYLEYILKRIKNHKHSQALSRIHASPYHQQFCATYNYTGLQAYHAKTLWAACCLGYFAFLSSGEFAVISDSQPDLSTCLTPGNIAMDNHSSPKTMRVRIKQSKANPFQAEINIYLGHTHMQNYGCAVLPGSEREQSGPSIQV